MKRVAIIGVLAFALFGLSDSLYLAQHEASAAPLLCNVQNLSDCNVVVASAYSRIFGMPVAELGVLFYGIVFIFAAFELVFVDRLARRALQGLALLGLLMSLYSTAVQIFFIKALCVYCLASAVTTVIILIFATLIEPIPLRKTVAAAISKPPPASRLSMPPAS